MYAWVNDQDSKRAYDGDGDDAYRVFRKILEAGRPPTDCTALLAGSKAQDSRWMALPGAIPHENAPRGPAEPVLR